MNREQNQYGGDLYYNTDDQEKTKILIHVGLDGIPAMFSVTGIDHDGKCLYAYFRTYKDYQNKFNPDYKKKPTIEWSVMDEEELFLHNGYAIIDIENQKILTICQDNVEYEWYPEFDWYTENSN